MKQVEVTILGQSYVLGCPEGGEQALLEAVATVDREMSAIRDGGKIRARERIAVLAALNLAFTLAEREARIARSQAREPAAAVPEAAFHPAGDGRKAVVMAEAAGAPRAVNHGPEAQAAEPHAAVDGLANPASSGGVGTGGVDVDGLIRRLDQALAADGQLI